MLPLSSRIAFAVFALLTMAAGFWGFYRLYRRVRRGSPDVEARFDGLAHRAGSALWTTLLQTRMFKKRLTVGVFHSFIFYGFVLYGLVNLVDAVDGYFRLDLRPTNGFAAAYILLADVFSFLVLVGVVALVVRRFLLPSGKHFRFNARTMLHDKVRRGRIRADSLIVSAFILFHVGSRLIGAAAKLLIDGPDRWQPVATVVSHYLPAGYAEGLRIFGYWGALGSVLLFLAYFPYTKHVHLFMAPFKYVVGRKAGSGVLPLLELQPGEGEEATGLGAQRLEDLSWPRIVDAYACIQCNRCQDVCPASATGKALSPAALEINKRMELNTLASGVALSGFETGEASPRPLLQFALSPEAAWACTTCGACIEVCPVGDEQMLDIIDIRRQQVMVEGEFPNQLQTAFRGMERTQNPWGINRAKRMDWAEGLKVKTTEENPTPEVLYWVGCAASYDPSAQKTARAFVQLLDHAGVDFAVLGKRECCTGDSARRAGNEYLYRQLADENVATLNEVRPKLIVASCPHCMNSIGKEYAQIGGHYTVMHHTEYLEGLVSQGKLRADAGEVAVTYHDPCYLGRHNGVYDAPRNLLNVLSNRVVEMPRARENGFCCGAGGAQFWKEEEEGDERISDNRFREAQGVLAESDGEKVLAVGCPFCKSMLASTPLKGQAEDIAIRDVAELLLEGVLRAKGVAPVPAPPMLQPAVEEVAALPVRGAAPVAEVGTVASSVVEEGAPARKKWQPKAAAAFGANGEEPLKERVVDAAPDRGDEPVVPVEAAAPERKKWQPKVAAAAALDGGAEMGLSATTACSDTSKVEEAIVTGVAPGRKKWQPRVAAAVVPGDDADFGQSGSEAAPDRAEGEQAVVTGVAPVRKKWQPKVAANNEAEQLPEGGRFA